MQTGPRLGCQEPLSATRVCKKAMAMLFESSEPPGLSRTVDLVIRLILRSANRHLAAALMLLGAAVAAWPPAPAMAEDGGSGSPVAGAEQAAIRTVIRSQMDAFLADDGSRAFSFASPGIRRMFQSPKTFMSMVRRGYPAVYRPRSVEFRDILMLHGRPVQRVYIVGPDNRPVIAEYSMERQPTGHWLIDGCRLTQVPERMI